MAAAANIVLADAQGTPVNHTFIPQEPDKDNAWWFEDQSPSNAVGYNKLSLQLKRPPPASAGTSSGTERMIKATFTVSLPTMEVLGTNDAGITPPPRVSYICRAKVELMLPERCTLQNRKDLRKYVQFLMADAQVVSMTESLQNIW